MRALKLLDNILCNIIIVCIIIPYIAIRDTFREFTTEQIFLKNLQKELKDILK